MEPELNYCGLCDDYVHDMARHQMVVHPAPRQPSDSEMLDWLMNNGRAVEEYQGKGFFRAFENRQAIAEAMQREKEGQ